MQWASGHGTVPSFSLLIAGENLVPYRDHNFQKTRSILVFAALFVLLLLGDYGVVAIVVDVRLGVSGVVAAAVFLNVVLVVVIDCGAVVVWCS